MASLNKEQQPKLIELKDLKPLCPWKTPSPPLSELRGLQYMKLKKPILKDGVKVYWENKYLAEEDEELQVVISYQGVFEFIDKHGVKVIKRFIDKVSC